MKGDNMHKYAKITTAVMLGALISGSAASCGGGAELILWTGFGSAYSKAVQSLIDSYTGQTGVTMEHQSQGSYDNLQSNLNNSVSTASYPHIANGYPDHFAGYIKSSIQLPLDEYIAAYNQKTGKDLLSDFYPEYMKENQTLRYHADGSPYTMGLPFNKSTEVMGYNGYFVAYAQSVDNTIKLPETWQEWSVEGPKMLNVMSNLYGNYLFGKLGTQDPDVITDFVVKNNDELPTPDHTLLLDCSKVTSTKFRLMSWDAADNMFITIVRQWGSTYTSYTAEDASKYQHGWAEYYTGDNQAKTKAALTAFKKLYDDKIFGLPADVSDDSYSSTAFKNNQCMFTICSSGGLSYNISSARFRVAPIPYYNDGETVRKYVISQGTNLALFDQGNDEKKQKAFDAMVAFCTGEMQAAWAVNTGYYPSCKSATTSATYQALLKEDHRDNPTKRAYQESAVLNENYYMNASLGWNKFVDPGFVGSSNIRKEVETIMAIVFAGAKDLDTILTESYNRIKDFVRK